MCYAVSYAVSWNANSVCTNHRVESLKVMHVELNLRSNASVVQSVLPLALTYALRRSHHWSITWSMALFSWPCFNQTLHQLIHLCRWCFVGKHVRAWLCISCNPQYWGRDCWKATCVVVSWYAVWGQSQTQTLIIWRVARWSSTWHYLKLTSLCFGQIDLCCVLQS